MVKGTDTTAMDQIAAILDGDEWDAEALDEIATIVRLTGRRIADPADCGDEQPGTGDRPYRCTKPTGHDGDHCDTGHPMHPSWRT